MSQYVTLNLRTDIYNEIIDDLIEYCSNLNNYWEMESAVHIIDLLNDEYQKDIAKQNEEFKQWEKYEELFVERFKDEKFHDKEDELNEKAIYEYKNFNKVNNVLEDFKEGGTLDILDTKQQFFLVLDILNAMK